MKKKRKLGRKLLSFLLTLAMVVGLMPGIGMTAYAADIPYASLKNTTNVITFDNKQWYLIDYDESTVTLLTKECVAASQYDSNGASNTYSGSTVETTVNNYYTNSISDAVKSAVVDNKMFLLTTAQATAMTEETRKCSQASGAYNAWWLCSPSFDGYASCVDCNNGSVDDSFGYYVGDTLGVRPALKLDLSKVTFDSDTNTFTVGSAQTPTETLLTTITPTSQTTYDQSVDGVVEVTLSVYNYYNGEWSWGENDEGSVMVEGKEGYTITKCEFICNSLTFTDTEAPFKINKSSGNDHIDEDTGMDGVTSIKVYGYATSPTETLLTGISLDKTTAQAIDVEGTVSFTATVTPDNATDKTVKWSVGGTNMYAVKLYSDANCTAGNEIGTDATSTLTVYAKGIRAGSATVTCTSIADSTKSASCDVMVVRERIGDIGDFYEGDILGYYWREMNASATDYEVTLQSGGYYIVDEGVGNTDYVLESDEWYYKDDDYTDNLNTLCLWDNDYEYKPYCNGHIAEYWIVVSASGEYGNKKVTLTGYDPGQNNNPFTEDVIYRRYSTDGKPLEDGTLSANVGIKVESDTRTWYNGKTYVVSDDVTISDRIKVIGTVNLILLDGAKLTAQKGISVNAKYGYSKTLNIYAGSTSDTILGTGQLIADARGCDDYWYCAGLGGDDHKAGGVLNIYGGVITAYGNGHGAGIGGGEWNYHNNITIYGGTISAYGGSDEWDDGGAGIGAGVYGGYEDVKGYVKIYGGNVTAVGGKNSAGIGGGAQASSGGDNVYVYGGTVVATGAAGKEGIGKGSGEGGSGNLTLGCVKLETSTDNGNWTEVTDTNSRTQYMKITPVPHDLTEHPAVAATCTTSGNSAYWKCNRCGKYFSDAEGLNEIAENSWVIPATGHNLSYSADNNTITATCSNSGCELAGKSLSVIAPEEPIFDGSGKEAHISPGYDTTVFPYVSDITYTKDNVALTGVPVDVGTYVASVSAGASESNCRTVSVTYAIEPASMTVNASDVNVEYDGNPHGISVNVSKPENGSTVTFGREEGTYDQSESPTITDVSDSPFIVYYKVTADNYEDYTGSAKVTITNASQTAPDAPTMDSATATSITLTNVTGCEYSKDGLTWQTSNIFTGLTPDTTYTFYQRKAAVTNYNASLASLGAEFSTSAHVHSFSYTPDGATITATCTDHNGCPLADSEYKATLTISANGGTYDGTTSYEATVTDENSIKGEAVVNYYKATDSGERGEALSPLTTAPTNAGRYWAEITLGTGDNAATAHVVYTIEKAAETAPAADTNQLNINYPDETILAKSGYEVASDDNGTEITNFSSILDATTPTVYIRKTASDDNHAPSDWVPVTLTSRPAAPTGLGSTNAADGASEDGTITGVNDTMEYSADGTNWTSVNGTTITGLKAGTYKVRVKATEGAPCGNAADVTVGSNYKALDDSVSVIIKKGDSEIGETVPVVDDVLTADCEASNIIYQWYRGGEPIDGATEGTYTLTKDDVGKAITVQAIQTKKADGTNYGENDRPKKMSESTEDVVKKDGPAAPASVDITEFTPDYENETFTIGNNYEVSSSNDEDGIITDNSLTEVLDGTGKIYIRAKETEDTKAGAWLEVTLPARPAAPTGLGSTNATDGSTEDGTITGVNDTMEYSADGTNWTAVNGTTITGLKARTYKVRVKATETAPCGNAADVTVGSNYKALDETVSVIIKKGDSAIGDTVPVVDDVLTADCEASNIIYQWYRGGEPIDGATEGTYKLTKNDVGKAITVQAIQTKKADGTNYGENDRPKKMSESTEAVVKKDGPAAPASVDITEFTPDYENETFTIGNNYEVSSSNDEDGIITDNSLTEVLDGTGKIYIRAKETDDTKAGAWLAVTLPARPAAPSGLGSTNATDGSTEDGTITGVNDTIEYSADGTTWTVVNGTTITGLKSGTYKVRYKATDTTPHGKAIDVTVGSRKLTLTDDQKPTAKEGLTYNNTEHTLLNEPAAALPEGATGLQYAIGTDDATVPTSGWETVIPAKTDAGTYYVWYKVKGDKNHNDTEPICLPVTIAKQPAPDKNNLDDEQKPTLITGLKYTGESQPLVKKPSTELTGYKVQYKLSESDEWSDEIPTGTDVGTYTVKVRYEGDSNHTTFDGDDNSVTISKADQAAPAAPTGADISMNTITLTSVNGCEYSKDGSNWQTSPTFTGLDMNMEYTFYQRLAGDDNHNASPSSEGVMIKTLNHEHNWSYKVNGTVITATCADEDGGHGVTKTATLTINKPALTVYGGTGSAEATITGSIDGVDNPSIVYKKGTTVLDAAPTDAGTYTIEITLGGATAKTDYTIAKSETSIATVPTVSKINYGQTLSESNITGGAADNDLSGTFAWKTPDVVPAVSDSGVTEYEIIFTPDNSNYAPVTFTVRVSVDKVSIDKGSLTESQKPAAKPGLKYSDTEQPLVTAPSEFPTGYTKILYRLADTDEWTDTIPTGKGADTYNVQVKYVGDGNHNDLVGDSVNVSIEKGTQTAPTDTFTIVNASDEINSDGKIDGFDSEKSYQYSPDGGETWIDVPNDATSIDVKAGDYKIRFAEDANHEPSDAVYVTVGIASRTEGVVNFNNTDIPEGGTVVEERAVTGVDSESTKAGVDELAAKQQETGKDIKVELEITPMEEDKVIPTSVTKTNEVVKDVFAKIDVAKIVTEYLAIDVTKYVDNSKEGEKISDTKEALEIALRFDTRKSNPVVVRTHNDEAKVFGKLSERPVGKDFKDAMFYIDREKGILYIYSQFFSDFAIVYATEKTYSVSIDTGVGEPIIQVVGEDSTLDLPTDLTKDGYAFGGWFKDVEYVSPWDVDNDKVNADTKIYGKWDKTVSGVSVESSEVKLTKAGDTSQIKVTVTPSDAANKKVTYASSNPKVVTVDENGKITAVANGTATITITTEDGAKTVTVKVTVAIPDVDKQGTIDKQDTTAQTGKSDQQGSADQQKTNDQQTVEPTKEEKAAISLNAGLKISQTGSKINIKWGKVKEADGYDLYVAYCGESFAHKKPAKTFDKNTTVKATITKINGKKINLKKNFKLYVAAYKMVEGKKEILAKTITGHVVGRKNTKYSNAKNIKITSKKKVSLKQGKTSKIKAKTILVEKGKKQLSDAHAKEFRYASSNNSIATVDKNGKIKGIAKGTCTIYVYSRNGYAKKVSVTVK